MWPRSRGSASVLLASGSDRFKGLGNNIEKVPDDTEVGDLEDRSIRVIADGDDMAGRLHADGVVDRAGHAKPDVQVRRNGHTRLTDLKGSRRPALVADDTGRTDGGSELIGEGLDDIHFTICSASRDNDGRGLTQGDSARTRLNTRGEDLHGKSLPRGRHLDFFDCYSHGLLSGSLIEGSRADRRDREHAGHQQSVRPGARQGCGRRDQGIVLDLKVGGICDNPGVHQCRNARGDLSTAVGGHDEESAEVLRLKSRDDGVGNAGAHPGSGFADGGHEDP